jgi:hypothetical protein
MKQAGVDAAACSCVQASNLALIVGAKQAGVNLKAEVSFSGADSGGLANATSAAAAQGAYFPTTIVPLDLHNAASDNFVATLKKYVPTYTGGYPSYGVTGSYLAADLMIRGLKEAGQNPTREAFNGNLAKVADYDADGLLPNKVSYGHFGSLEGHPCSYYVQFKGSDFTTVNNGQPFCGTVIPDSAVS